MADTWGIRPASFGANFSATSAATMWANIWPFDIQQFLGSGNKTLPLQADDPLADVLEEIGIGSTNSSHVVLDIKAFMNSLGGRPIYSRFMLQNAAYQLNRARRGEDVLLMDCYGNPVFISGELFSSSGEALVLEYYGIHALTELFQADDDYPVIPVVIQPGERVERQTRHVDASHIDSIKLPPGSWIVEDPDIIDRVRLTHAMNTYEKRWRLNRCITGPRDVLHRSLRKLMHTARISNIVCIGLGTLQTTDGTKASSIVQHMAASSLAQDLTQLYEAEGIPLENPITIIAQDPAYTALDRLALSELPVPIEVVNESEGFLAMNQSSLVFSSNPSVPVKQLIADLATEAPDSKGPAALFINNEFPDKNFGNLDVAVYNRDEKRRLTNPETKGYVKMLESYTRVLDGKWQFENSVTDVVPGFE